MQIEQLRVARYRSLYDVTLRPGQFTVLVGANNSGKTNFVDAIDFLADAYRYGLEIAVSRKGGFENIAHRKQRRTKSPLLFALQANLRLEELDPYGSVTARKRRATRTGAPSLRISHEFEIEAQGQAIEAAFRIRRETLRVERLDAKPTILLDVERTADELIVHEVGRGRRARGPGSRIISDLTYPFADANFLEWFRRGKGLQPTELLVGLRSFSPGLGIFARMIASTRVYQLAPLESRRSGVPTPNPDLGRHGANLPAFVAQIKKGNPAHWDQVLQMMRRLVPGLEEIRMDFTPDRRLTLQFVERGSGRPWSSDEISDGTIQSLALFTALFDPRSQLVVIEEPENSVHPWIVRNFVDACRSARDKQIIVTTHSPALINYLRPSEVAVVWRHQGETTIKPLTELDTEAMNMWADGKVSTFEILDSGWVGEAVPGGSE